MFHRREKVAESGLEETTLETDEREKIRKGEMQVENTKRETKKEKERKEEDLKKNGKERRNEEEFLTESARHRDPRKLDNFDVTSVKLLSRVDLAGL